MSSVHALYSLTQSAHHRIDFVSFLSDTHPMFIGHFAVALAAKKVEPRVSLWVLILSCQFLDLLWPILVVAGVEHLHVDYGATVQTPLAFDHYPYSHSLVMALFWGVMVATVWAIFNRSRPLLLLVAVTFSHWILDFVTHAPDLQIIPGWDLKLGLGLWNYPFAAQLLEMGMTLAALVLYFQAQPTFARRIRYFALIALLAAFHLANLFGPKPPLDAPEIMIAGPALAMWIFIPWAWWIERPASLVSKSLT